MKVFVYGTLKSGHWNSRLLEGASFVEMKTIKGYRLKDAGFPAAIQDEQGAVVGEVYDIGDPETDDVSKGILQSLDWLESNGSMYDRTVIEEDISMYVACQGVFDNHPDWPVNHVEDDGTRVYEWSA